MTLRGILTGFLIIAPVAFLATLLVTYLYGLIVHGTGSLDWEFSIRLAIILGITLSLTRREGK